jgi:hypothetical protein
MKKTIDENRRKACLAIVDKVTRGRDIDPRSGLLPPRGVGSRTR